jgi:hypothetical protein
VDTLLPVWAQPHSFALLDDRAQGAFTFGLVLTELRSLAHPDGVRLFGRRFGYEWLPGLADGVQRELRRDLPPSELQTFLREQHGILGPRQLDLDYWGDSDGTAGEPADQILDAFATSQGQLIKEWSLNAFNMVEVKLQGWARTREQVELGHGAAARKRLQLTQMPHALTSVTAIDGSTHWARQYTTLYQRVALELEDLAVLRPKPRICPLCGRVYIPLRRDQSICANQTWGEATRRLVRRCTPANGTVHDGAAAAAEYRRHRKTQWAAMNRVRKKHGHNDHRTKHAIDTFEAWKKKNPPPMPPGRPPKDATTGGTPPYQPEPQAAHGNSLSNASTASDCIEGNTCE